MQTIFKSLDHQGTGKLDRKALLQAYRETKGVDYSETDVDYLISRIDNSGSGQVNYNEFLNSMVASTKI